MKSAIVTGAGGFLGSHLCEELLKRQFHVIGVDNFSTGTRSHFELLKSLGGQQISLVEADVVKPWGWIEKQNPEVLNSLQYVFHFASPASPPLYQRLAIETIHVNTIGLENAIQVADSFKGKVIFASTSEVYGDPAVTPQPETYWGYVNSFGERSCYDESKRCGEAIIHSYNKKNKTQHGLVRIFNTYGPRMNPFDGRVVINFLVQALKNKPLTVYGDGKQTRSFCYVDDLVSAILTYAEKNIFVPVNIGNPKEFTILQLAETVQKLFSEKALTIQFEGLPSDDPKQRRPDISQALERLSPWKPSVPLETGLQRMCNWLKEVNL